MHCPYFRTARLLLVLAGLLGAAQAQAAYNVTIVASGASSGGTWVGNVWTASAAGAQVLASEVASHLASGAARISTGIAGAENGDITVNASLTWSTNTLTLSAYRNIEINIAMNGSGTAGLALEYGQGAVAAGSTATYKVHAPVNLASTGTFSTRLGSDGVPDNYTILTILGVEGSATGTDLQGMSSNLAGNYVLGADIDASATSGWNGGAGFAPVGNNITKFTGNFSGLGHTVTGLTINRLATNYVGLFGYATGTLRDVGLINSNISGWFVTGSLAGRSDGAVSYSYADGGSVTGDANLAGGLLGQTGGSVDYSYANVSVTGNNNGISSTAIGGLVGGNNGSISNSYATGSVHGGTDVGGLVGQVAAGATVTNAYSTGAVIWTSSGGGLIGWKNATGTVTNSYWDTTTSGVLGSAAGTGKTTAEMQSLATFAAWDVDAAAGTGKVWRIYQDQITPLLRHYLRPLTVTANNATKTYDGNAYSGGNGLSYSTAPDANLLGTASYGGTSQGAVSVGGYTIVPGGLYSNQRGYDIAYAVGTLTIEPWLSHAGPTTTGSGNASATVSIVSGGGTGCGFTVAQFVPLPVAAPAGVAFPHGLFDFTVDGCATGSTLSFTVTYPQPLPAGTQYWKYGRTLDDGSLHWYVMPATIAGNTATFSITDGGLGDDDLTVNGTIVDQGGPGVGITTAIPTLSEWGLLLLAGLLGWLGLAAVPKRTN